MANLNGAAQDSIRPTTSWFTSNTLKNKLLNVK